MSAFFLAIGLAAMVVVVVAWGLARRRMNRLDARAVLLDLAPRVGAPPRLTGESALRFDRRGFPAAVSIHPGTGHNVEVSFRLNGEETGWITVSSLGFKRALLEQIGFKDVQVGDVEFDERLEVWGHDEGALRRRLRPEIRGLLLQVERRWDFLMRLTPDQLVLRARVSPLDRHQVETLAGIGFQILDLLDLPSPSEFVLSKVEESLDDQTRCSVCGSPLSRGPVVRCATCRAAHHADCWQFNGLCATFACGSREKRAA